MSTNGGNDTQASSATQDGPAVREDDFFVTAPPAGATSADSANHENAPHMLAFDYWHGLHAGRPMPLFSDLSPAGLHPFKPNSLLLEFHGTDLVVRFCGSVAATLFEAEPVPGYQLEGGDPAGFSEALHARYRDEGNRGEAAEFEFAGDAALWRGMLLPLSAHGDEAELVLIVVDQQPVPAAEPGAENKAASEDTPADALPEAPQQETTDVPPHAPPDATPDRSEPGATAPDLDFDALAGSCANAGAEVVHPGVGTRKGLYEALAVAYAFHLQAMESPDSYRDYLASKELRQQARAPFTPALKLTFGPAYDKTRLAEYAAALAHAARQDVAPDDLVDFLNGFPGGIKGCVRVERGLRRGTGEAAATLDAAALEQRAREAKAIALNGLEFDGEFGLVLVRRNADDSYDLVAPAAATEQQIRRALSALPADDDE